MKKIVSLALVIVMIFCLSACSGDGKYKKMTDEEITAEVKTGNLCELHCYYSVDNDDRTDDEILVHFPAEVYDEEKDPFYDSDAETHIIFYGDKALYSEKTGEKVSEDDIEYGQLLKVVYNGEAFSKNPVTIKAVKVIVCD